MEACGFHVVYRTIFTRTQRTQNSMFHKHLPDIGHHRDRDIYVEIIADKGYTRWDARYEILMGNLLDPPTISKGRAFRVP